MANTNTKRNERVIIDKPYGQVVIKTRDVVVQKDDLSFERFLDNCEVTYDGSLNNPKGIEVSYLYHDGSNDMIASLDCEINEKFTTTDERLEIIRMLAYKIFKQLKEEGEI